MHPLGFILEQGIKIKDYFNNINKPVKTNKTASKYSINFFILTSFTNLFKPLPNSAHKLIVGKHIIAAVIVTNKTLRSIPLFAKVTNDVDGTSAFLLYGVNLPPGVAFEVIQGNKFILKENDKLFLYHTDISDNVMDAVVSYVVHVPEAEYTV